MDQRQFFLRDILTVIFKRKRLLITLPLVLLVVVVILSYIWPPTYESMAKIQLMRGRETSQADPTVTRAAQSVTFIQMTVEDINSEIELLHSEDVLRGTVNELGLHEDPAFPYGTGVLSVPFRVAESTLNMIAYGLGLKSRPTAVQQAMNELDSRLITQPVRDSFVLDVRLRLGDPKRAQEVLVGLLQVYKEHHIKVFQNEKSEPFFREQLDRVEGDLRRAQNELEDFRNANNISLLATEKELLLEQYTEAQRILSQLRRVKTAIGEGDELEAEMINSIASETDSTVVREMQLRLLELLLERNRIVQSLGPKHPQVESIRDQITRAEKNLVNAIETTREITQASMSEIQERLDTLNSTMAELERQEKDVEILTTNYEYYSEKLEESVVADRLAKQDISNVKIASAPSLPTDPIRPNKLLNIVLAIVGGIILALALAFFLDYLDHGLKTPEDVEYHCKVSTLASFFSKPGERLSANEAERLSILLDTLVTGEGAKVYEVTSSVSGEGSEQVAAALADAYANNPEQRTLLVDLAATVPQARNAQYGLADVLLEQASFEDVFRTDEDLTVVSGGGRGEYPGYLWGSARMHQLMDDLRGRYDRILFHAGPVLQSHDALKVARHADGVVLAVKSDATRREVVNRALEMFREADVRVAGAVMTERTQTIPQAVYRRI